MSHVTIDLLESRLRRLWDVASDPAETELEHLRRQLEHERNECRKLREALELAASYFHAPLNTPDDEAAWKRIVAAIRSSAGRDPISHR